MLFPDKYNIVAKINIQYYLQIALIVIIFIWQSKENVYLINHMKNNWKQFTTDTGLKAAYLVAGEDLRNDVKIKIVSKVPKGFYYSCLNEAGSYFDETILPTLTQKNE